MSFQFSRYRSRNHVDIFDIGSRHGMGELVFGRIQTVRPLEHAAMVGSRVGILCIKLASGLRHWPHHFGGSKPLARQRSAIAVEVSATMKARAAAGSVLLDGIAVA